MHTNLIIIDSSKFKDFPIFDYIIHKQQHVHNIKHVHIFIYVRKKGGKEKKLMGQWLHCIIVVYQGFLI